MHIYLALTRERGVGCISITFCASFVAAVYCTPFVNELEVCERVLVNPHILYYLGMCFDGFVLPDLRSAEAGSSSVDINCVDLFAGCSEEYKIVHFDVLFETQQQLFSDTCHFLSKLPFFSAHDQC